MDRDGRPKPRKDIYNFSMMEEKFKYIFTALEKIEIPESVEIIEDYAFKNCTALTTINVPWSEGEVASAPWGATNATINYNYTGE